jgi:hypothetical protein
MIVRRGDQRDGGSDEDARRGRGIYGDRRHQAGDVARTGAAAGTGAAQGEQTIPTIERRFLMGRMTAMLVLV